MNIVTGGCSYSETQHCVDYTRHDMDVDLFDYDNYKSWALHLGDIVSNSTIHNTAMPGAGNGYISRAVIYKVNEMLDFIGYEKNNRYFNIFKENSFKELRK